MRKIYPTYEEAKRIVQENGIKSQGEYNASKADLGLPSSPAEYYNDRGWVDWYDFLGKKNKSFPTYEEAKRIVQENGIKSQGEYNASKTKLGLPSAPYLIYNGNGWIDWFDFLGKERRIYPSYEEAKRIVQENGIESVEVYRTCYKALKLPSMPYKYYMDKGWEDWFVFFGKKSMTYPSYEEARTIIQEKGIKTRTQYTSLYTSLGLPSEPHNHYRDEGWIDWDSFLGRTPKVSTPKRKSRILTILSISPELLNNDAPLKIIYLLASQFDRNLAKDIEELLGISSSEERLKWVKEQLNVIKEDSPSKVISSLELITDEFTAIESIIEEFKDVKGTLSEEVSSRINTQLDNYLHSVVNKELIKEVDGE